jgi:hypothetical protein
MATISEETCGCLTMPPEDHKGIHDEAKGVKRGFEQRPERSDATVGQKRRTKRRCPGDIAFLAIS